MRTLIVIVVIWAGAAAGQIDPNRPIDPTGQAAPNASVDPSSPGTTRPAPTVAEKLQLTPLLRQDAVRGLRQRLIKIRPRPFLFNADGTPFRPGQRASEPRRSIQPPADGGFGDWLRFIGGTIRGDAPG